LRFPDREETMDRRTFLQTGLIGTLATRVLGDTTLARAQTPAGAPAAAAQSAAAPRRLILDAYSRHLHWLRTADEVAEAAIEMTCGGVMPTVQAHPGHVNPENVARELPAFVNTIRKHGLRVKQIRGGNATDVNAPHLEAMVGTMGQLGVTHYWVGTDNYNLSQPILPQLDAIKLKVEQFVKLNEKHGTTLMYHTRAGANSVGSVVWDLLYILKDFDPKHVGIHWDTGHMSHHGAMWETLLRTAGPYIVGIGWKDRSWRQDLGQLVEQGGPFPGPQPAANAAATGAGGRGGAGRGAAAGGRGGAAGAGGRGAAGAGGPGAGAGAPAGRGAGGAGGAGGGRGGRGGGPRDFPLPLAGTHFARGGGWTSPYVPMGMGLVNVFRYATVLSEIGFDGPMELEAEYPIGGAESGADRLTLPRLQVIGSMKRDVLTIRAAFDQSGSGLTI
jgi:sugar phosphate isomerase/epimerase